MGLVDRFSSSADREKEALRLIDAGNAIEDAGGLVAEALRHYESAVNLAPDLARGHLNRGNALLQMGNAEGAIAACATAVEKKPDYAAAHLNIGNAYARSGRSEAAIAHYQRARGITTTVESLYMGVPVLTLAAKTFLSRQGVGLLMNAGLPEWIAADADDYVARGAAHARDRVGLATLLSGLRQRGLASPIFDPPRFAYHFSRALRGMWHAWCRHTPSESREV